MQRSLAALVLLVALGCDSGAPTEPAADAEANTPGADGTKNTEAKPAQADGPAATPPPVVAVTKSGDDLCSQAALPQAAGSVATVGGTPITAASLGDDARDAEREALHQYCREVHRIREAATQRAIEDHLLASAAKAQGVEVDVYVRNTLDAAVKVPDDAEIAAFFEANKTDQAPPLEQVKGQVEEAMVKERTQAAYESLMQSLRKEATVAVTLPDVRPPAFDLTAAEHTATFGPKDAKVRIVEFSDFECPYCARAAGAISTLKGRFGDSVEVSYRHFPLSFHPAAQPAAELSQCAQEQGKFWDLHDAIFGAKEKLSPDGLRAMATEVGLDMAKVDECLASGRARQQVEADLSKGRAVGVQGTPAFYVDGRPFDGRPDELIGVVEAALAGS